MHYITGSGKPKRYVYTCTVKDFRKCKINECFLSDTLAVEDDLEPDPQSEVVPR